MSMMATRRAILAGIAASIATEASARGRTPTYAGVRAVLDGYVAAGKLAGACVAIQPRTGAPTFLSFGRVDPDPSAPAFNERSVARIYSMTKPVTGLAAMQLIDEGKLGLDQPIAEIFKEFAAPRVLVDDATGATRAASGPILVRHLLTHTAGLGYSINRGTPLARRYTQAGLTPGSRTPPAPGEGEPPTSLAEFATRLAEQPLASDPGAVWTYSVALDLLGAVIERVAGKPFEDVLRARIFAPLGMNDTAFFAGPGQAERMTSVLGVSPQGVQVVDPRGASPFLKPSPYPAGGAGLVSTAADYARLCAALLGRGEAFGERILSRKAADLAVSNLLPPGVTAEERGNGFGAGLRVITPASAQEGEAPARSYGWGGAAGTTYWCDPTIGVGVVFMAQFFPSSAYPTAAQVRRAFYADRAG